MKRENISPGVYMTRLDASKFNRQRITLHFQFPNDRATATVAAVLPLVLERGWAECPDMTELSRQLARLYGADLAVDTTLNGGNRIITVDITGIKNEFALNGENLSEEYARLVFGMAFQPYLVEDVFDPEAVEIEKQKLALRLETEINDKRLYCIRQARRNFFAGSPAAIERDGYLEEVPSVTAQSLKAMYDTMIATATIDVMVQGADVDLVRRMLLARLAGVKRSPAQLVPFLAMPRQETEHRQETFDMVQAKLCMMFTCGTPMTAKDLNAARLAMSLFGGGVSSRLFLNVREKQSLCYYCASTCSTMTGSMIVDSGIEPANTAKAEAAILKEWEDLKYGEITDEELEDCRRSVLSGLQAVEDSLAGEENWYYMEICRGEELYSPAQSREELLMVTKEDVRNILKNYTYSLGYLLTTKEAAQ